MNEAGKSGNGITVECGLERLDVELVYELLRHTHLACDRPLEVFERAIKHSLCFGAYAGKRQIGFARAVTDHATFGYLQDFIVDPSGRGQGIGRHLLQRLMTDPIVSSLRTLMLRTETAHGLYQKAGFSFAPSPQDVFGSISGRPPSRIGSDSRSVTA